MPLKLYPIKFSIFVLAVCYSQLSQAWGERGHDLITRIAVQDLVELSEKNSALTRPFELRDHMLSHLSNAPDIVWRAPYMTDEERALNYPTHYINLERVYDKVSSIADLDTDYADYAKKASDRGLDAAKDVGTAPWRALQLYQLMQNAFKSASSAENKGQMIKAANQALLYGGLMSHFVGDLANPHHTSSNHDGQLTGNKGLHAYFESDVVSALSFKLAARVNRKSNARLLRENLLQAYPNGDAVRALNDPSSLITALVFNSHSKVEHLTKLDNRHSIIELSKDNRSPAIRKSPKSVTNQYDDFIIERLAIGASVLSQLWYLAWQTGGKPDLSEYRSYLYPVQPAFIAPDYIIAEKLTMTPEH